MILLPIFVSVTNKTKFMPEICRFFGIITVSYTHLTLPTT